MGKSTCRTALGPPARRFGHARAARDAALYGRICRSPAAELHQNPAKPVSAASARGQIRVLEALQRPRNEQLWGHLRHNRALIHRTGARRRFIPVGGTAARGVGAQACAAPKFLVRQRNLELSTERAGPYYYHYPLIKNIKKKTGQQEDRGRDNGGWACSALRENPVPAGLRVRAEACRKASVGLGKAFDGVGVWGGGTPIPEWLSGPGADAAGGSRLPSTAAG